MAETCSPLPAPAGTSVAEPCTGLGPVKWCGDADYFRWRRVLQTERWALVERLNAFIRLANAGKVNWDATTSSALTIANEDSYYLLQQYPFEWWGAFKVVSKEGYLGPIAAMSQMAAKVHLSTCQVEQALVKLGEPVPGDPTPPPPPVGWTDPLAQGAENLARAATYLIVAGGVLIGGIAVLYYAASRATAARTGGSPAPPVAGPLPLAAPPPSTRPSVVINANRRP